MICFVTEYNNTILSDSSLNDAQESGYAGNAAIALWETIIRLEMKQ